MIVPDSAFVLYVDHQGHPAPLSLSFHATASRRLAASIDRHPPSTVTEVDSAYCPQCLTFHDANSAANMGYCPKASCRLCPLCSSVASIVLEGSEGLYKCGSCSWSSRDCSLVTKVTLSDDGVITKEELEKAGERLAKEWTRRTTEGNQFADEHYRTMLKALEGMAKEKVKGQRSTMLFSTSTSANARRGLDGPEGWSVESLEESLVTKRNNISASVDERIGGHSTPTISLDEEIILEESLKDKPVQSLFLQGVGRQAITSANDLLPLPIPLRPRKSRRCRAELAEGRPGILLKPKLNPLEGDSSLRTGHGQWWKKDSSAIQVLPRVTASIHASDGIKHAFLLKIANPTLGAVRFRLSASTYEGEPTSDNEERTPFLENILVDPLNRECVNAKLVPTSSIEASEVCELEPAEDSFLELGKSSNEEPEEVDKWNAQDALATSTVSESNQSSLRVVGCRKSCAWMELILLETAQDPDVTCAVPLALQIEVGDGSWESSLIQPEPKGNGEKDMVTFDLVITWGKKE